MCIRDRFTAPDGGDKVTSDTVVNGDMTVYAQWERIIPTYTVRYDLNGGDGTIAPASIKEGEKVAIPTDPTRNGYKFLGWFTASTGGDKVCLLYTSLEGVRGEIRSV